MLSRQSIFESKGKSQVWVILVLREVVRFHLKVAISFSATKATQ